MRQQINLYQPIFSEERKPFSAAVAFACLVGLLFALGALSFSANVRVKKLDADLAVLRAQQQEQERLLAGTAAPESVEAIEARVALLERRVRERSRALEVLRTGAAGTTVGFAPRLEALARRHVEGLWIEAMQLSGTDGAMMLAGSTLDPDLVPKYLRSLAADAVLSGTRFDDFVISRPLDEDSRSEKKRTSQASTLVRFRAGSSSLASAASTEEASS